MIITDLMELDGKEVIVVLNDNRIIQGKLQYVPSYSEMYEWKRPHYFYIGDVKFRSHFVISAKVLEEGEAE